MCVLASDAEAPELLALPLVILSSSVHNIGEASGSMIK
jgi:hypothetical protein